MNICFEKVCYSDLNARQKEIYNFQLLSGKLAQVGYQTILLSDDWNGAELLALKFGISDVLRVQLKTRFGIFKKYLGQEIYIAFRDEGAWYLFPHDLVVEELKQTQPQIFQSQSWIIGGAYTWKYLTKGQKALLNKFRLPD